ncbi:hypothetical protein [Streptomyces canus]|uniref:hypothetical protein n=1 Tax=Streptomyces canus TaxID=58343 RepID=UPI0027806D96|nr:hypothetical protein [Streptomyces canus]MDQ0757454.1 hypothetical protein [Streptomyces canus]
MRTSCGDEAIVRAVLDVLEREFRATSARPYDNGQRANLQLDAGCTDPDSD